MDEDTLDVARLGKLEAWENRVGVHMPCVNKVTVKPKRGAV